MTEEEKNAEKRKHMSLTNTEFLTFFFFPFNIDRFGLNNYELNKKEDNRFLQHGFDKKLKEARAARLYGRIFYFGLVIMIGIIIRYKNRF